MVYMNARHERHGPEQQAVHAKLARATHAAVWGVLTTALPSVILAFTANLECI